jgi:hypothetical protein
MASVPWRSSELAWPRQDRPRTVNPLGNVVVWVAPLRFTGVARPRRGRELRAARVRRPDESRRAARRAAMAVDWRSGMGEVSICLRCGRLATWWTQREGGRSVVVGVELRLWRDEIFVASCLLRAKEACSAGPRRLCNASGEASHLQLQRLSASTTTRLPPCSTPVGHRLFKTPSYSARFALSTVLLPESDPKLPADHDLSSHLSR